MALLMACILWVFLATGVAFLPMRYQFAPGIVLVLAALVLIWLVGRDVGLIPALLGLMAFISMFRRPLRFYVLRMLGKYPEVGK